MNTCQLCEEEYNNILPNGYCIGCDKALRAQQRNFHRQMMGSGNQAQMTQHISTYPIIYN